MLAKIAFGMTLFYLGATTLGRAADQFPADTDFVRKAERSGNQEISDSRDALTMSKDRKRSRNRVFSTGRPRPRSNG